MRTPLYRRPAVTTLSMFLTVILLTASCEDDPSTPCPTFGVGVVEGYVLEAGVGVAVEVGVRPLDGSQKGEVVARTRSDSTGWYRLTVPAGRYRVDVNPGSGRVYSSDWPDTVHIPAGMRTFDVLRGRAAITIQFPDVLNGRELRGLLRSNLLGSSEITAIVADGRARFEFPLVTPGEYLFGLGDIVNSFWLPGTYDASEAQAYPVAADDTTAYVFTLDEYASIRGSIHGSWEASGLSPPRLYVYSLDSTRILYEAPEPDGSFMLELFRAEPVKILSDSRDIVNWFGGTSFETATTFALEAGDQMTGVDLVENGIRCQLEGPGQLASRRVSVLLVDDEGHEFRPHTSSSATLVIGNLPDGRYRLYLYGYCDEQLWASQWYDGADSMADATPIDLEAGQLVDIAMRLAEGGRIAGTLLGALGFPIDRAEVILHDSEGRQLCHRLYVYDGDFAFTGLGNESYCLAVGRGSYDLWWYPGTANQDSAMVFTIRNHETVEGLEWTIPWK